MDEENNTTSFENFIESEWNYYFFLQNYTELLIGYKDNLHFLQTNHEKLETQIIVSSSLIENIHLHLLTRHTLLKSFSMYSQNQSSSDLRNQFEHLRKHLNSLLRKLNNPPINHRLLCHNKTTTFPDYSFDSSIKAICHDKPITYNPW